MRNSPVRRIIAFILCYLIIYTPLFAADQLALPPDDIDSPEIVHDPINETFQSGVVKPITATVTDNVGVKTVVLFYRQVGAERYQQIPMRQVGDSDEYSATLDPQYYVSPGIEYYIQAVDIAGNRLLHGYAFSPMKLAIEGTGQPPVAMTSGEGDSALLVSPAKKTDEGYKKWIWIGLGVLAAGALLNNGDDGTKQETSSLELTVPTPSNESQ